MVKPGYKQTEIGLIPEEWEIRSAKDLMRIETGSRNTEHKADHGQYPFFVRSQQVERIDSYHYDCEAVLTAGDGVGTGKVFHYFDGKFDAHQRVYVMSNFDGVLGKYFFYFFSKNFSSEVLKYTAKSSVDSVRRDMIAEMLIPLPLENEQANICEAIFDVDQLIEILEKQISKKRAIKQGAMQELLTGKRRLPGFDGRWISGKWKDVLEGFSSGATPYRGNSSFYNGTIKWVSSGELNYNRIFDTIEHISQNAQIKTNLSMHPAGTFLMAITGLEAAGTRGSCAILGSSATTNQSCMAIYGTERMSTEYLFHYYVHHGDELAFQYCQGTKQQSYTAAIVKELPIYYPEDVREQNAIASLLTDMDNEIEELKQKLDKYRLVKQGMMQQLLTGKIRLV